MEVQRQPIRRVENTFLYKLRKFFEYLDTALLKYNVGSQLVIFKMMESW